MPGARVPRGPHAHRATSVPWVAWQATQSRGGTRGLEMGLVGVRPTLDGGTPTIERAAWADGGAVSEKWALFSGMDWAWPSLANRQRRG